MGSKIKVEPVAGWLLVAPSEDRDGNPDLGSWYVAWLEPFRTKKGALDFAKRNSWPRPYRAMRGQITVQIASH